MMKGISEASGCLWCHHWWNCKCCRIITAKVTTCRIL